MHKKSSQVGYPQLVPRVATFTTGKGEGRGQPLVRGEGPPQVRGEEPPQVSERPLCALECSSNAHMT